MTLNLSNPRAIISWTPRGTPTGKPAITEVIQNALYYTFHIRYNGRSYDLNLRREALVWHEKYEVSVTRYPDAKIFKTNILYDNIKCMRSFYDTIEWILYRIQSGTFQKHYGTN
jgi:hypothetical protein